MTTVDWLWLLHPALAVALVYPLRGATLQLAIQTRHRRLNQSKASVTSGAEHSALGRWLPAAVVAIQLIAYVVVIFTKQPSQPDPGRSALLLLVLAATVLRLARPMPPEIWYQRSLLPVLPPTMGKVQL
jgi:hypothetical protein